MPTYDLTAAFRGDLGRLKPEQRKVFRAAVEVFVADLRDGRGFRRGLRIKKMRGHEGIRELTWAPDGRATFRFGEGRPGDVHIIWRRIGSHAIFTAS
ncbi:MAG: hypothetical protein ACT4RN_04060 [Pseudonocardia sp.]